MFYRDEEGNLICSDLGIRSFFDERFESAKTEEELNFVYHKILNILYSESIDFAKGKGFIHFIPELSLMS